MTEKYPVGEAEIDRLYEKLDKEAENSGYHLNPDRETVRSIIKGMLVNEKRYGYMSCPCRLSSGNKAEDLDIICPCFYRDEDLNDYDACYCSLYVSAKIKKGEKEAIPVPERRGCPLPGKPPVWRCRVCGYLCARPEPPETCPICKAGRERFERFNL